MKKKGAAKSTLSATSPKALRFTDEYLVDCNGANAARRAGYSARSAKQAAHELLQLPEVQQRILAGMQARAAKVGINAETVLAELLIIARSDVRDYQVNDAGELTLRDGVPEHAWRAVSSVKHRRIVTGKGDDRETTHEIEYRLWDKNTAVTNALKHLGLLIEKHEHDLSDRLADALKLARERVKDRKDRAGDPVER